jgi:hypothetical protein
LNARGKKDRQPTLKSAPTSGKTPRVSDAPRSTHNEKPAWRFTALDTDGPWCWTKIADARYVIGKLRHFETMTWGEIRARGSHAIAVSDLVSEAQARLEAIKQGDIESVFSLRLTGRERVFGILDGATLKLLWWDPLHEVCPSTLKHT